jgi:hypothetical protein
METDHQVSLTQFYIKVIYPSIVNANEKMELEFLRGEVAKLKKIVGVMISLLTQLYRTNLMMKVQRTSQFHPMKMNTSMTCLKQSARARREDLDHLLVLRCSVHGTRRKNSRPLATLNLLKLRKS